MGPIIKLLKPIIIYYLTLNVDGKTIIVEATSPLEGFVTDGMKVKYLQESYINGADEEDWTNVDYYRLQKDLNNSITLKELNGLQYYNLAVQAYNNRNLSSALELQDKALSLYPSERLEEMMVVMLNTLEKDQVFDSVLKQEYLVKYQQLLSSIIVAHRY